MDEKHNESNDKQEQTDISAIFSRDLTENNKSSNHRQTVLLKKTKRRPIVDNLLAKKRVPAIQKHQVMPLKSNPPPVAAAAAAVRPPLQPSNISITKKNPKNMKSVPEAVIQKPTGKKELVFVIRGNVRDAFDKESYLEEFVKLLSDKYDISIYIHTWINKECKKTWRHEASMYNWKKTPEELIVTEEIVRSYFIKFKHLIKKITFEDEEKVILNGRTEGHLTKICTMPTKSWKLFIHNLYTSLTKINKEDRHKTIFSMRFDMIQKRLFSTWHGFDHNKTLESFFKICCSNLDRSNLKYKWCKMQSIGGSSSGYDNAILGDIEYLEKIFHLLEMKLDTVLVKCAEQCDSRNQEIFVERLRDKLIHNINHFDFIFKEP